MTPLARLLLAALAAQSPGAEPEAPELVEQFVARAVAWIDEQPGAGLAELREAFSEELKAALPEKQIERALATARDEGAVRMRVIDARQESGLRSWTYLLEQERSSRLMVVTLDPSDRVSGWWIKVAPRLRPRLELVEATQALAGDVGLAIELDDAEHRRLDGFELEIRRRLFPLGSIFKLYVLAELARSVDAGERSLDDELEVVEARKSLPSGEMQDLAAGTKVKLRDAAREMIRISDNTATDHLLFLLGREKVEAGLRRCCVSEPERLKPFLSTLEMFAAKSLTKEQNQRVFGRERLGEVAVAWREAKAEQRREWLAKLDALLAEGDPARNRATFGARYGLTSLGARQHVEIEWLARPRDVVRMITAAQRGELHSPGASEIFLELYGAGAPIYTLPGVVAHGYKGGSETHIFALSTRVVLPDGRSVVACLLRSGFEATDPEVPEQSIQLLVDWMQNLIEGEPARK